MLPLATACGGSPAVYTVVQPGLCVICNFGEIESRGCLGAPDLIITVLAPGTAARDRKGRFDLYEEASVNEYWIVAPLEQDISVIVGGADTGRHQLAGECAGPGSVPCATLPGLELNWNAIFTEPLK